MKRPRSVSRTALLAWSSLGAGLAFTGFSLAADPGKIVVQVDQPGARISPMLYGLMTEEINHSYDGGLYAELIQNRVFKNAPRVPRGGPPGSATRPATAPTQGAIPHWSLIHSEGAQGEISLDTTDPVNMAALTTSLKLNITTVAPGQRVGVANDGFWGIPVRPDTTYLASFYAKGSGGFTGPLTIDLESDDGTTIHASAIVPAITDQWQHYHLSLKTGQLAPSAANRLVISAASRGTINLNLVSLFPPVFTPRTDAALGGRPATGFRADLMQLLDAMHPAFLRFPGGNYVEGFNFENRFDFKATIGPWEQRPTHMSPWGYRSSDGMGLLEFLEWCEELKMEPVLAVYAGLHLDGGRDVRTGDALKPFIQDALDEIEYVSGDVSTQWGGRRARDGHPAPFKLTYVEIGNEDFLNRGTETYGGPDGRYAMFYKAIKAKYPDIQVIATVNPGVPHDVIDNHHYMPPAVALRNAHLYDKVDRKGPRIFEGEWASQEFGWGRPLTPTFQCALSDAAFLTGLERNADIVIMSCYAPLFTRMDQGGNQWRTNLIGYNSLTSFGSPSYYAQKMFAGARGDQILPIASITPQTIPPVTTQPAPQAPRPMMIPSPPQAGPGTQSTTRPTTRRFGRGPFVAPVADPKEPLFACASKEDASGDIILKVVNAFGVDQTLTVNLAGAHLRKEGVGQVMVAAPSDTNSLDDPLRVVPRQFVINDADSTWIHTFPGNSITVIRFKTR